MTVRQSDGSTNKLNAGSDLEVDEQEEDDERWTMDDGDVVGSDGCVGDGSVLITHEPKQLVTP